MSIAKITKGGWIMKDTWNAARKFRRFLIEAITEIANREGMKSNQINIFEEGNFYNILLHDLQMEISWRIDIVLFWYTKTTGITSVMFGLDLL